MEPSKSNILCALEKMAMLWLDVHEGTLEPCSGKNRDRYQRLQISALRTRVVGKLRVGQFITCHNVSCCTLGII